MKLIFEILGMLCTLAGSILGLLSNIQTKRKWQIILTIAAIISFGLGLFLGILPKVLQETEETELMYATGAMNKVSYRIEKENLEATDKSKWLSDTGDAFGDRRPNTVDDDAFIEFTIENHGDFVAVVDDIFVEVVDSYPMPKTVGYRPFEPTNCYFCHIEEITSEDSMALTQSRSLYPIFKGQTYGYPREEVDKFRLNIEKNEIVPPQVFEFRIRIDYHIKEKKLSLISDKNYFYPSHPDAKSK